MLPPPKENMERLRKNTGPPLPYVRNVHGTRAVSYTHLDVYKRQLYNFEFLVGYKFTRGRENIHKGREIDTLLFGKRVCQSRVQNMKGDEAVSWVLLNVISGSK